MHIDSSTVTTNGKSYTRILLRESFREDGKVKHRTIGNLSNCKPVEIEAIRLALSHKADLTQLGNWNSDAALRQGSSVGAVLTLHAVAKRWGIVDALGTSRAGRLALWQVLARIIDQGSRLSAVRLATTHAACDILELDRFNEDDLYQNLDWLAENQDDIENRMFRKRQPQATTPLFLYDVTSSYLEGTRNELAAFGYNRDGKKGKRQIVIGLMCDAEGEPVSIEVFQPQIESLLKQKLIQRELFDECLAEVTVDDGVRYVLRRNPVRAAEIAAVRQSKRQAVETLVSQQNTYLAGHPQALVDAAVRKVSKRLAALKVSGWLSVAATERMLALSQSESNLAEVAELDGCYCLKTDLSSQSATKELVHGRYKSLAQVEWAFRTCKTAHLELRPVHVRLASRTRGHVLVVMLAYRIIAEPARCWQTPDLTVAEGIAELESLCTVQLSVQGRTTLHRIPEPRDSVQDLLTAAAITLPSGIVSKRPNVTTKRKLPKRRKALHK